MDNFAADTILILGRCARIADAADAGSFHGTFADVQFTVDECRKARNVIEHMTRVFAQRRKEQMQVEIKI